MLNSSSCCAAVAVLLSGASLAACSRGSGVDTGSSVPSTQRTAAASPSATIDPEAQPAVDAYLAFNESFYAAERTPFHLRDVYPAEANFVQYSFDPIRIQRTGYVNMLAANGLVFRGTPPEAHIRVKAVALDKEPYPTVILTDCATGDDWIPQFTKTGKPAPTVAPSGATVPKPYLSTWTVIYYKKHWGVQQQALDVSRTCTP